MNLKDIRKQKMFTQKEMSIKLKITQTAISKWENNKATPSIDTMFGLAEVLGEDVTVIMACFHKPPKEIEI